MNRRRVVRWGIGLTVTAVLGIAAKEVHWALTVQPVSDPSYLRTIQAMTLENQPASQGPDAWPELLKACSAYKAVVAESGRSGSPGGGAPEGWPTSQPWPVEPSVLRASEPDPVAAPYARELLAACDRSGVWAQMDTVAAGQRFVRPLTSPTGRLLDVQLPELSDLRTLAQACIAQMREASLRGDGAGIARAYGHAIAIARAMSLQVTLMDRLISDSVLGAANDELRAILQETPLDERTLAALLDASRRMDSVPPHSRGLECERQCTLDVIASTHDASGRCIPACVAEIEQRATSLSGSPTTAHPSKLLNLTWPLYPRRAQSELRANSLYNDTIKNADLPRTQRFLRPGELDSRIAGLRGPTDRLLAMIMPALGHYVETGDRAHVIQRGTQLTIALHLHRARHGRFPSSLAELNPGELSDLPLDPYSDGPFGYFIPRPDADPRPYLLYSLGADRADNEGAEASDPLMALREQQGSAGTDFVFIRLKPR